MDARALCRFFQKYAREYAGTVYSAPLPDAIKEAERAGLLAYGSGAGAAALESGSLAWALYYTRSSKRLRRRSFTGQVYEIPPGALVLQNVARRPSIVPPVARVPDVMYVYQEDRELVDLATRLGLRLRAVRIAATSELLGVYRREGPYAHKLEDEPTLVALEGPDLDVDAILREVEAVTGYRDDYPYYNLNNSWQAASLRGFKPADPLYGLKPREMSRKWLAAHPEDRALDTCADTTLAARCPAIMGLLRSLPFGAGFERVRLLRLTHGELLRHCDITDRDLGTRDGQLCRLHMPIVTSPLVSSSCWDLQGQRIVATLQPWRLYYMDIRKPHAARNDSPKRVRIHLQIDVVADHRLRQAILRGVPVGSKEVA